MSNLLQRVAAKVVIESDGAILALHPSEIDHNRKWQIPGGIRDSIEAETITETGYREVYEETGLDIRGLDIRTIMHGEWTAIDKNENVSILAIFMHVVLPTRPQIVLSEEHDDYAWLSASNIDEFDINPEVQAALCLIFPQQI